MKGECSFLVATTSLGCEPGKPAVVRVCQPWIYLRQPRITHQVYLGTAEM